MPSREQLESWVCDALQAAGGWADSTTIRQYIWLSHENSLRAAGPRFFTWQLDVNRAIFSLKRRGLIRLVRNHRSARYWEIVGDLTNAFEAMCRKASENNWCWKLGCTTCGNQDFRYGLAQIALGRHPVSSGWDTFDTRTIVVPELPSIRSTLGWPDSMKAILSETLTGASLKSIARQCPFPDWLGYVGVVLHMVQDDEEFARQLTRKWLPDLRGTVRIGSGARSHLDEIRRTGEPLRWQHIDGLESGIRAEYQLART